MYNNKSMIAQVNNEATLQGLNLETQHNDEHAIFFCLSGQNDTVKLVIDLDNGSINIEVFMFDCSDIDTHHFESLSDAIKCLKVYASIQKAYKSRITALTDLL